MTDVNDIKAGKYQLVAELWDEATSKPGEPFDFVRHRKGDIVTLNQAEAKRLVLAGAVVEPGSVERAQAQFAAAQLAGAMARLTEEQRLEVVGQLALLAAPPAPLVLDEVTGNTDEELGVGQPPADGSTTGEQPAPPKSASKAEWVAYATSLGMLQADADAATKDDLVQRYGG